LTQATDLALRSEPADRRQLLAELGSLLAGFAAGTLAALIGNLLVWPILALGVGALSRGRVQFALLGLGAAAFVWTRIFATLSSPPPFEGPDYRLLYGVPLALVTVPFALWLGARLAPPTPARGHPTPSGIGIAAGLIALVVTAGTAIPAFAVPSRSSFAFDLPSGWNTLPHTYDTALFDPTYGDDFTAVLGSSDPPKRDWPPTTPILGVSTVRVEETPAVCIQQIHGWSTRDVPLYQGETIESGKVDLPTGAAFRKLTAPRSDGSRLYGWGIVRTREVGVLTEPLCYMLVLSVPEGTVTTAEADAIAASFRFR
jgi:hypothetical protein